MHFFNKTTSSSSSYTSSSSTPSSPSVSAGANAANSLNHRGQSFTHRKLTRQRKLRHATDQELGLQFTDRSNSPPRSPGSARKPTSSACSDHWLSSAVPQPLPLPESPLTKKPESSGWNSRHGLPGSPDEGLIYISRRNSVDHVVTKPALCSSKCQQRLSQDANVDGANCGLKLNLAAKSAPTSGFSSPMVSPRKSNGGELSPLLNTVVSTKSSSKSEGQGLHLKIDSVNSKLSRIVCPRSAPTSGFSSPAVSPQRSYTGDFLPSFMASQAPPIWLDLETSQTRKSQTSRASLLLHSADHAPVHTQSLQIPYSSPGNGSKFSFPSQNKLLPGYSKEWPESTNRLSAHPLPLPPRATLPQSFMPSPQAVLHNTTEKPNVTLMKSQWQKGKLIGRGTYGSVYVGTHRETGALCAMKEVDIIPDDRKSAECIKQLEQEIRLLQHLEHPNIVQYYGSEIVDNHFYIYLEYVYPGSINRYVHEHCGAMTESIVRNFTRHILSGLAYLHSRKTIHRDIKGANLLVNSSGIVKLADFGMAKHLTGLSYELSFKGSPHWMAPEVIKAVMQKDANPDLALAADIWSLGCTVIEMLTGKPPWGELQGPSAMFKALNRTPPIPEAMSPEAKDFLCCCFRRNPADRPSATALLDHPFVRNSSELNVSNCRLALSTTNPVDKLQSPRDCAAKNIDMMPTSSCTRATNEKLHSNGETGQKGSTYTFNCLGSSYNPPCSPREVLPTPQLVCSSRNFNTSSNVASNMQLGAVNNHPLALLRSHGRELQQT